MVRDRVLIIDDDPDLRELVSLALADVKLACVEAGDCLEALPLLERDKARLRAVLLDYFMPGPPPAACAKAILERIDPGVPVVLVSAAVDIAERAAELGLTRYLAKPFDMAQLHAAVGGAAQRAG
jgi:DNA-binding NtrC family response regulator